MKCECGKENISEDVICLDCGALLRSGRLLGDRFKLIRKLENGQSGWVKYKALDRDTQRNLCVNILIEDNKQIFQSLETWINRMKELVHPNIVSVFGFYTDEVLHKAFITMEDISDRKTVRDLLIDGKFPSEKAKKSVFEVCDALSCAHAKGLHHGDIRPENLIIGANGEVRLLNFGLAPYLKKANTSITKFIPGHEYSTPVDIKDEREDIYRLGLLLSEMLPVSFIHTHEGFLISSAEFIRSIQRKEGNFDCFGSAKTHCDQIGCLWRKDCLHKGESFGELRFLWPKKEEGILFIDQFKVSLKNIGQELEKCKICGYESSKDYLFCEMCGNVLREKLCLGNYELQERSKKEDLLIGIKYLALDKNLNKRVTLYIYPDYIYKPEAIIGVREWYESIKELKDDRVVKVLGFFDDFAKKCRYLVREYAEECPTFRQWLNKGKKFSDDEIIEYATEISKGLSYAYSKGILHLDIRPENIILGPGNKVMLNNFRLNWVVKQKALWQLPESINQYEVAEPVQRSDIFQFGLALYEMIDNRTYDHKAGFVFPDNINEDLKNLIKKMLDKSESTRYLSIDGVEKALAEVKIRKAAIEERRIKEEKERKAKEEQERKAQEKKKKKREEQKSLEEKIVGEVKKNPKGITSVMIGEALGVKQESLMPILVRLVREGRVGIEGGVYLSPVFEEFRDNSNEWRIGKWDYGENCIRNGRLSIEHRNHGGGHHCIWDKMYEFSDFIAEARIEAEVRVVSGYSNYFGMVFRRKETANGYSEYCFDINGNGNYRLYKMVNGKRTDFVLRKYSPFIKEAGANILKVKCDDYKISLYANDHLLTQVNDASLGSGKLGFWVEGFTRIHVEYLKATGLDTIQQKVESQEKTPEMILVPAGEFIIGSPEIVRKVYLNAYFISKYPVTNKEYREFVEATGYLAQAPWRRYNTEGKDAHPVVNVTWFDAVEYCNWLSQKEGFEKAYDEKCYLIKSAKGFRLPTGEEWEKAARGTDGRIYPWGNEWDPQRCNCWEKGPHTTTLVGSYLSGVSPYGCHDMAGNVWEWCQDQMESPPYEQKPKSGTHRVVRGGSFWATSEDDNITCRTYHRRSIPESSIFAISNVGFRCVRGVP